MALHREIYTLFGSGGHFSCLTENYAGIAYQVSAGSVRQAYAVAHKGVWVHPDDSYPAGIISIQRRDRGHELWCGCQIPGLGLTRGDGVRAIRRALREHVCSWPCIGCGVPVTADDLCLGCSGLLS